MLVILQGVELLINITRRTCYKVTESEIQSTLCYKILLCSPVYSVALRNTGSSLDHIIVIHIIVIMHTLVLFILRWR